VLNCLRILLALGVFPILAFSDDGAAANSNAQDTEKVIPQPALTDTAGIKFEAKLFREPDASAEILATVPVGTEVQIVGAPGRGNNRAPSMFVEVVYENQRGFVTEGHFDKSDPRLMPTLRYMQGEHISLHSAVKSRRAADAQWILESAPDVFVNYQDDRGLTALMYASRDGSHEIVQLLLHHGADPNLRNGENETSFLLAAKYGHVSVVAELLKLDAIDIDAADQGGRSAYTWAVAAGLTDVVELLKNVGAAPIEPVGELPPYVVSGGITAPKLTGGPIVDARARSDRVSAPFSAASRRSFFIATGSLTAGLTTRRGAELGPDVDEIVDDREWLRRWADPRVVVEIIVHGDGTTRFVRFILKPYESEKLDERFIDAVRKHEFEPALLHGEPIDTLWFLEFEWPP